MKNQSIPKVNQLPFIGKYLTLKDYLEDRLSLLKAYHRQYGDIFDVRIGPRNLIVVSNPDIVQHIMQRNMKNYIKKINFDEFFGNSIFTTNNEEWKQQRDLLKPLFNFNYLQSSVPKVQEIFQFHISNYEKDNLQYKDIRIFFTKVTFEIILQLIVGIDIKEKVNVIDDAITNITHYLTNDNYALIPHLKKHTKDYKQYKQSLEILDKEIYAIIKQTRKKPDGKSFIHYLLSIDEKIDDKFIRDNLITVIGAGYETTAMTMSWIASLLAENSTWQSCCIQQAKKINTQNLSYQDLHNLTFIDACINETMRLFPAGWGFTRFTLNQDQVNDYQFNAGDLVLICPYLTQRDPKFWKNPEIFNPGRFLENEGTNYSKNAFFPFGSGPRTCLGMSMALMEMKTLLVEILKKYHFEKSGDSPIPDARATIYSKNGFSVKIVKN